MRNFHVTRVLLAVSIAASSAAAQRGRVVVDTVRAPSLANRLGAPAQTRVSIYLPPSYDSASARRYPTVYLLHGFGGSDMTWTSARGFDLPGRMETWLESGGGREMIVVMPSAANRYGGSFYTNSGTTGNWDDFITRDLVAYVDARYRTIARPESRGLAGHSMGGFGTMYLGIRHGADVFGAMYAMSACCTSPVGGGSTSNIAQWDTVTRFAEPGILERAGFYPRVLAAMAAAFVPDSTKAPLYFDTPLRRDNGSPRANPAAIASWNAHSPLWMVEGASERMRRMRGIAFDVGLQDELVSPGQLRAMDSVFTRAGIPHTYETYEGTHTSKIAERLGSKVLPFFARVLEQR